MCSYSLSFKCKLVLTPSWSLMIGWMMTQGHPPPPGLPRSPCSLWVTHSAETTSSWCAFRPRDFLEEGACASGRLDKDLGPQEWPELLHPCPLVSPGGEARKGEKFSEDPGEDGQRGGSLSSATLGRSVWC